MNTYAKRNGAYYRIIGETETEVNVEVEIDTPHGGTTTLSLWWDKSSCE